MLCHRKSFNWSNMPLIPAISLFWEMSGVRGNKAELFSRFDKEVSLRNRWG
jgi:hypothetical protein